MPSAFAVQPQLRQPSYSIGHVNVPLNTPVSIQQSTNGKIHSHSVQNIPPPIQLSEMGKGVPLVSLPKNARIFVVQFKGTRSDVFFYNPDSSAPPSEPVLRPGVCVILEADRGQDLGLIIEEYRSRDQVVSFMSSHEHISESCALNADVSGAVFSKASGSDSSSTPSSLSPSPSPTPGSPSAPIKPSTPPSLDSTPCPPQPDSDPAPSVSLKDIYIKRIFRVADQSDIEQVNSKIADEQKALLVCQSKVRQKKLPMEVCDAEFQWDRRKLTFYFIADRRIDFRELVRELFKTYKTRIWMCAVDQKQQQQQQQQSL
ncbi:hypothetical protein AX774_g5851 [Zancudomyces culisetae]|uniref:PSP1 C-terminal domain-containing protein n=1 Tax=Zancudomyces culisetae TaxID=1213189 RepID=A0A1R1PIM5_ZANCU|nr:hypothetical protein AX774_g5851 [Zancudomyces culisetae]|eukprot:OMH80702.1 hypothetical protein AX774_g5851 [Zancudomyces culisetae]